MADLEASLALPPVSSTPHFYIHLNPSILNDGYFLRATVWIFIPSSQERACIERRAVCPLIFSRTKASPPNQLFFPPLQTFASIRFPRRCSQQDRAYSFLARRRSLVIALAKFRKTTAMNQEVSVANNALLANNSDVAEEKEEEVEEKEAGEEEEEGSLVSHTNISDGRKMLRGGKRCSRYPKHVLLMRVSSGTFSPTALGTAKENFANVQPTYVSRERKFAAIDTIVLVIRGGKIIKGRRCCFATRIRKVSV